MYLKMCSVSPSQHFVVQSLSCVQLFATPWTVTCKASLSFTNPQSLVNSCLSSWWCHPNVSSSVSPFFPCPQSFPASGSFPMFKLSQLFLNVFLLFYMLKLGLKKIFKRYHLVAITVKSLINLLVPFLSLFSCPWLVAEISYLSWRISHTLNFADCFSVLFSTHGSTCVCPTNW